MISRVADHCFWYGRYVERAEATARLLAATQSLALDAELEPQACWRPVVVVSGEEAQFLERVSGADGADAAWGDGEGDREHARGVLRALEVATEPEAMIGDAGDHLSTQVSLEPPPWLELTTYEPSTSAVRVRPPGNTHGPFGPVST